MLRIAVPNKGALSQASQTMLIEAGYLQRRDTRELVIADEENNVEFFYLRPRDIAVYVGSGILDVGITGRDLLLDSEGAAEEALALGFAKSTFRFAGPAGEFSDVRQLAGKRVATSYDKLLRQHLADAGIDAGVVRLDGAIESSIRLGVADAIADVVETGNTMRAAGLEVFGEPIMRSEALLIRQQDVQDTDAVDILSRRLQGVLVARQYVMMDYDIREDLLEAATAVTPGLEAPTVSALSREGWVAVRAMVPKGGTNQTMDRLYEVGARAILVSPIAAARL
ncbi:ATP phosphoribosyltransferase [Rothia sp. AR01]|uniref:ATP phosphoribosyltransferase n=1 Tax=Rothia santali TaxID=2949643 RepID=A0A9X2HJ03_9MICC|nr:ATP phosphoribosyltransferase [Rothia santali]MCP3425748.1 ATP phosphoribosyltransferase [Rothia santali]